MTELRLGPDSARYLYAGDGGRLPLPFNLRWLLPAVCGDDVKLWRAVWLASWPVLAAGAFVWADGMGATPWEALAAAAFLVALPGLWGPHSVRPVGVDLPAMAVAIWAAAAFAHGLPVLGVVLAVWAATIKESYPVWVAFWAWNPWALLALVAVVMAFLVRRPQMDPITDGTPILKRVHDHPIASSLEHHRGQWRNAWYMVAPWGVTLAALVDPSPRLAAVVAAAYAQLIVVTDTVRVYQTAAGPVVALAAAQVIPLQWLALAVAVHVVWWREPVVG